MSTVFARITLRLIKQTPKAYLLGFKHGEVWVPKSQCKLTAVKPMRMAAPTNHVDCEMPDWLLAKLMRQFVE